MSLVDSKVDATERVDEPALSLEGLRASALASASVLDPRAIGGCCQDCACEDCTKMVTPWVRDTR